MLDAPEQLPLTWVRIPIPRTGFGKVCTGGDAGDCNPVEIDMGRRITRRPRRLWWESARRKRSETFEAKILLASACN